MAILAIVCVVATLLALLSMVRMRRSAYVAGYFHGRSQELVAMNECDANALSYTVIVYGQVVHDIGEAEAERWHGLFAESKEQQT